MVGPGLPTLTPRRVVLAALAAWFICVVLQWLVAPPLAHDEAAYALMAREGIVRWAYRPIGMVAIARVGLGISDGELALRALSVLLGLSFIPAVAYLGRRFGEWTGAWAAALVAGSQTFLLRGFQLLNDIPAAACVLVATAIALDELGRSGGPRYRLVLAAPLCAVSVYLRYGSVLPIAVIAACALLLFRSWLRRPGPVAAFAAAFALLLAPLLVYSHARTGSIVGLFDVAREAATYPAGQGFHRFVLADPLLTYGVLVAPVMLAGLVGARSDRREWLLALASIVMIAWLGLTSDGSTRFLFIPIVFLVIIGVRRIGELLTTRPRLRRACAVLVVTSWLAMIGAAVPIQRHIARGLAVMRTASSSIRADAAGRPCAVVAYWVTELMWYSGCEGVQAPTWDHVQTPHADLRWYAASMPLHPVEASRIAHTLGVQAVPLPGGAAWYLVH